MLTPNQQGNFIIQFAMGDSAGIDEVATINFYGEYFSGYANEYKAPPEDFDPNLIDVFLRVLNDPASEQRVDVTYIIAKLMHCAAIAHAFADRGACTVLADYVLDPHKTIRLNCLSGLVDMARHCSVCNKAVRATNVMDAIEALMRSAPVQPFNVLTNAALCNSAILKVNDANVFQVTGLIPLIVNAMKYYETESELIESSLLALAVFANKDTFTDSDLRTSNIEAILAEKVLIEIVFKVIGSGNPTLSRYALQLIARIVQGGTNAQREPLIMRNGFVKIIGKCVDSTWRSVQIQAASVLAIMADGPRHHIELILKEVEVIVQLMPLFHHDDKKMQEQICWIFAGLFGSSADKPELTMEEFVENGVRTIVDFATKSGADTQIVNMIREVLPKQLLTHAEFARIVEQGFLSSLALFTKFACFRAVTLAHSVLDHH